MSMIIDGINCPQCDSVVLDNPNSEKCHRCNATYPQHYLQLIQTHSEAKMRLVGENVEPAIAVTQLAVASRQAAALIDGIWKN
jgi:DNA-directed RNA polymerase subunit RPC12/RpoP